MRTCLDGAPMPPGNAGVLRSTHWFGGKAAGRGSGVLCAAVRGATAATPIKTTIQRNLRMSRSRPETLPHPTVPPTIINRNEGSPQAGQGAFTGELPHRYNRCPIAHRWAQEPSLGRPLDDSAQRVLLTGGAGFVGSHVAEALLRGGRQVVIVDYLDDFYSRGWKQANLEDIRRAGSFELFSTDICEAEAMREVMARARPQAVIHLAARAGVRASIEQPRLYERVNVAGTVNVLELCREFRVTKVILGSSSAVYGATSRAPFSEE